MKKFALSIATTLMATTILVACNGSTNDGGSPSGSPLAKAVCTASANWNAISIGMSLPQVEGILGKPTSKTITTESTEYTYESCRGFVTAIDADTGQRTRTDVGGSISWTGNRGVIAINAPKAITETTLCEVDFYNYPIGSGSPPCRTVSNPY